MFVKSEHGLHGLIMILMKKNQILPLHFYNTYNINSKKNFHKVKNKKKIAINKGKEEVYLREKNYYIKKKKQGIPNHLTKINPQNNFKKYPQMYYTLRLEE